MNNKTWYWVGAVVVVAVVVWWLAGSSGSPLSMNPSPSASGSPAASGSPVVSGTAKPGTAMPKTYSDALAAYAGKRIQFDQYCQAIPTSLVFKNGVSLMLDNRSGDARPVKVNGVTYSLAGYGWRIVTLSVASSKLPAHLDIDCGSAQNVSYVVLEK